MTSAKRSSKPKSTPKLLKTYVDLSKLRKASLKRYKKHFNLDVKADSKTELLEAVGRHFAQMPVREADVAREFQNFWRMRARPQVTVAPPTSAPTTTTPAVTAAATTAAAAGR